MTKRYPFPQKKVFQVLFGLYLFSILYFCRVSQVSYYLLGFYKSQFLSLSITLLALLVFLIYQRKHLLQIVFNYRIALAILFAAAILIPMCVKKDWQMMYFSILLSILMGVFFSYFISCAQAGKGFCVVMATLAAYSLAAFFALRPLADRGILAPPVFVNAYGGEFYNYLLAFVPKTLVRDRNFGIFREPGVYQFFLFLALYLCFYHVQWEKQTSMWVCGGILCLTLLSTFSTGAIAAMAVLLLTVYFEKKLYRSSLGKLLTALVLGLGIAFLAYLFIRKPPLYATLLYMFQKVTPGNPSFDDRFESIHVNLHLLSFRPKVGRDVSYVLEIIADNTSSTTILFAILGIFSGWLHVIAWLCLVLRGKGHIVTKLLCLLALAVTFNTQNLISDPYFWIFPIMALIECVGCLIDRQPKQSVSVPEQP